MSVPLCDAIQQTAEIITMQILADFGICLDLIFTTLMNLKKLKINVVLGQKQHYEYGHVFLPLKDLLTVLLNHTDINQSQWQVQQARSLSSLPLAAIGRH